MPANSINNIFLDTSGKEVFIAGHTLDWWEKQYQLPLHINYVPLIKNNIQDYKSVFQKYYPNGKIKFAGKAYASPAVFKIIAKQGIGIDAASYNETRCALESGVPPELIDLNGNAKEDFLIKDAIEKDMLIVADNSAELKIISNISAQIKKIPKVILRITGFELGKVTDEAIFTAGVWSKFGIEIRQIPDILNNLKNYPQVNILGFHTHIGSQIADLEPYLAVLGKMIELGHLLNEAGGKCRIINIGGGFPVSYLDKKSWDNFLYKIKTGYLASKNEDMTKIHAWNNTAGYFAENKDRTIDFSKWAGEKFYSPYPKSKMLEAILTSNLIINNREINTVKALKNLGEPALIIEPGRSIVGDTGITLAKVAHVREIVYGHNLMVLEMGVVNYGEAVTAPVINRWDILSDYHQKDSTQFETFVAGNLCFSGDMISRYKISLQRKPKRGDIVVIYDTGSYDSHFFAANANSFPRPSRLMADENGNITLLKKRDTFEEIFS